MRSVWRVEMLGTLRVVGEGVTVTRFRTRRVALLLGYLAFYRNRQHFREEIGEMLWPEQDAEVIRRNLRQALTSSRHVVEPPPIPPGSVLLTPQGGLQLNPELVATDVAEFEAAIAEARHKSDPAEQFPLLQRAIGLYKGELLPSFQEDWIASERLRLDDLFVYSLRRLIEHSRQRGSVDETIDYLRLALDKEPYNEDWHIALMQQYLDTGRPDSAIKQFNELRQRLREHLGCEPSAKAQDLLDQARWRSGPEVAPPTSTARVLPVEDAPEPEPTRVVRLPVQLTRFCGRRDEIDYARDHLLSRKARLTTLVGPAGTGKTRLSIEIGRLVAEGGPEWNVWFVPLADLASASMMLDAILDTMRARRTARQDTLTQLSEAMRGETNLLILDNMEHIVEEAGPIIGEILERVPNVQILVTSRHTLRLQAEHQIVIPPLDFPSEDAGSGAVEQDELARLAEFPSIQLFVDRCQTVRPDFQLTTYNARSVAAICAKLEGIPLAIELAAGLSSAFTPPQMAVHLQKRMTTLTSRRRDMPIRHRSLRAAIDYSYGSLSPAVQRFFAALSIFRGGFTVEAAYEVCYKDRFPEEPEDPCIRRHPHECCLDVILDLQERSLLRSETSEEGLDLRFRMLESFREYAEEHLSEAEYQALRARHAEFYRSHPPAVEGTLSVDERTRRHLWILSEFDNYIAAMEFCFAERDMAACISLQATLATTWMNRGPRDIERRTIHQIAERKETERVDPALRIQLLRMLGTTCIRTLEYAAAERACLQALEIAVESGQSELVAVCYSALSTCAGYLGKLDECLDYNLKVLETAPPDNLTLMERTYQGIGAVHWGRGETEAAEEAFLKAAEISARLRSGEPESMIVYTLARVNLDQGRFDAAMNRIGQGMRICHRIHDEFGLGMGLSLVSRYHWLRGNLAAALATGHEALMKYRGFDFSHFNLLGFHQHALALTEAGEWEAATTLFAATQGIGLAARKPDHVDQTEALAKIRRHLPVDRFERAWAKGLTMDTGEAFRLALRYK